MTPRQRTVLDMNESKVLSVESSLEVVLRQLGITRLYKGCAYVISAVKLVQGCALIDNSLYKTIAEQHGAKPPNLYTNMRNCLKHAQSTNPLLLSVVMDCCIEGRMSLLSKFIESLASWIERREALLVFDDKSSFGKIVWNERGNTETTPTQ